MLSITLIFVMSGYCGSVLVSGQETARDHFGVDMNSVDEIMSLQNQLLSELKSVNSKLEAYDAHFKISTNKFESQLQSLENKLVSRLNTQDQNLNSRMNALAQGLQHELGYTAQDDLVKNLTHKGNQTRLVGRMQNVSICDRFKDQLAAHDDRLQELDRHLKQKDQLIEGIYESVVGSRDCADIRASGKTTSGVYRIYPGNLARRISADVYCDMDSNGIGWLVFQRRMDGSVNFERDWTEYADGFGRVDGEFWIGNDILHTLTSNRNYKLRVDMEDFDRQKRYAEFGNFSIRSSADNYRLAVASYSGDAGDSLLGHNDCEFSTPDVDNDKNSEQNCAQIYHGGWWYNNCHASNLNGKYLHGEHESFADGVNWLMFRGYHHSLKITQMKITPIV